MKIERNKALTIPLLSLLIMTSLLTTLPPLPVKAADGIEWYQKPSYMDYAQSGVPDFDQRQNNTWKNPYPPYNNFWSWCGPVAVANSLWWMDSRFETGPPPPTYSDTFPLVQNYGPWDDKDPRNVDPLIGDLAKLMLTDVGKCGTLVSEMQTGIRQYLIKKGLQNLFYERTWECNFSFYDIEREIMECEDVVLLLGFYEYQEVMPGKWVWVRVGGHYVTVAGVGWDRERTPWIKFSDPILNYAEDQGWGPPYVLPPPGMGTPPHNPHPTNYTLHNNATYVSHDPYMVGYAPVGCGWGPVDYNATGIARIGGLAANGYIYGTWQGGLLGAAVEAAVIVSPIPYFKPPYEDYAPSGMPDFDQKQDGWKNPYPIPGPTNGSWSWCGPTAVANSLWYFDSKFETESRREFPLVPNYGPWDDHSPLNVPPLINNLGWYMDTDGNQTHAVICGTEVHNMTQGIIRYLGDKGLSTWFTVNLMAQPTFQYVEHEVERCEDVVLLLGFWQWQAGRPVRVGGHYVTVAGVHSPNFTLWISDPFLDAAEMGIRPGRVLPIPHIHPPVSTAHNDAQYVSHDMYNQTVEGQTPGNPGFELDDYPAYEIYSMGGFADNCPDELKQYTGAYDPAGSPIYTEVEYAVVVSPVCDKVVTNVTIQLRPRYGYTPPYASAVYPISPWWYVDVYVTVENLGLETQTFNVTAYYDSNLINAQQGNPQTITLIGQGTIIVNFTWILNGVPPCTRVYPPPPTPGYYIPYNISINVCGSYTWLGGTVTVRKFGDATGDGHCDGFDYTMLNVRWLSYYPQALYNPNADFNGDGNIDGFDFTYINLNWLTY